MRASVYVTATCPDGMAANSANRVAPFAGEAPDKLATAMASCVYTAAS